jgi:hypothetical protein
MKRLLLILILTFSFQSVAKADDIRDFEIEGMSIGDSLLKHYSKNVLDNIEKYYYPNSKKIVGLYSQVFNKNLNNYDAIQFSVTPDNYQIEAIAGLNYEFENKKKECYQEMENIFDEIQSLFPNSKTVKEKESSHEADVSGKSVGKIYRINLSNGFIRVTCTDWAKKMSHADSLKISIHTIKHIDWINNEAY